MFPFEQTFWIALSVNILLTLASSLPFWRRCSRLARKSGAKVDDDTQDEFEVSSKHHTLLCRFLIVYLLATLSDWLQGPYVYAVCATYGYSQHNIAILFIAAFGSSLVFGSFVGVAADRFGRRRSVVAFAIISAIACVTKHFKNFYILFFGRLLGGIAASLLFSVFEAWLVRSYSDAKLDGGFLSNSFGVAAYGNSIIAIVAGLLANTVANSSTLTNILGGAFDMYAGGYLNPFDVALFPLALCAIAAIFFWDEYFGGEEPAAQYHKGGSTFGSALLSPQEKDEATIGAAEGVQATREMERSNIVLCGLVSSLFEGSLYNFVFMWTPMVLSLIALEHLPFGVIFSTFMVCSMAGSSFFLIMSGHVKQEILCIGLLAVSFISMAVMTFVPNNAIAMICAMNIFYVCVGMYWPVMGMMKSEIVPEHKRATIYALYRIPVNLVVICLLMVDLTPRQAFGVNCVMLFLAIILQTILTMKRHSLIEKESPSANDAEEMAALTEKGIEEVEG